jgi:adenylate cyclase
VLEARATAHGQAAPLQPVLSLMRAFFGIDEEMPAGEAIARVRAASSNAMAAADAPLLLDFLGLPLAEGESVPSDIAGRRARLLETVKQLARGTALAQPSLLVIEDLHWLDQASEPFVDAVVQAVAGTRTLLLVNFRPGYRAAWMERSFYEQIALIPLADGAVSLMIDRLLGVDEAVKPLRDRIVDRAAGNPFFAEELVRTLIEAGAVTGEPGAWRPTAGARETALPETVQSLLGTRIDRLEEQDKLLLQAAAIVGREFPLEAVAEIAELEAGKARESAARLLAAEMLYERPDLQRDAFAFRHPLVQEAAQSSLVSTSRRELNRRAATALGALYKDRAEETSALIGHHWEEAGEMMQAAAAYVKAALWIGTRDPRQALEAWRKVRRLLEGAPTAPPVDYMTMMACGQIVNYAWREGIDADEVEPVFEQAMALARKLRDMRAAALITMAFGRVLAATGSAEQYVAKVEEAQMLVQGANLPSVDAVLAAVYSHALSTAGRYDQALAANTIALDCVDKIDARDRQTLGFHPEHWLLAQRARALMLLDRMEDAEPIVERLLDGKMGTVDALHRALALGVRIEDAARIGRSDVALMQLDALDRTLRGNETPYLRVLYGRYRGIALFAAGDIAGATSEWRAALDHSRVHRAGLEMRNQMLALIEKAVAAATPSSG